MNLRGAIDQAWRDVRYAWRLITRERGFAAVVIVTLALAVAANTAIYSVIDAVMFRQLPFEQSERLVSVSRVIPSNPQLAGSVSVVHFDEWRRSSTSFEGLSLIGGANFSLTGTGEPENIPGARVSASLFSVLRVPMQLGRTFLQEEEDRRERVVIVSDDLWRTRFQARAGIVGQAIALNGVQHIVIGVLPPGFSLPLVRPGGSSTRMLLYVPIDPAPFERDPRSPVFAHLAVGRLKAGVPAGASDGRAEWTAATARDARAERPRSAHDGAVAAGARRERLSRRPPGAVGRRDDRAAHHVRQRRESTAGPSRTAAARACGKSGSWREPDGHRASAPD